MLRFLITRELQRAGRPLTIPEIVARIERQGFTIYGRPSLRRINLLSQTAAEWIVAITRTQHQHTDHTPTQYIPKPWDNYHWLWRT